MFIIALFIIVKRWKQPKCSSTGVMDKQMRYIHITEYYSVIKRNEVLTHTKTWMKFECFMLNKQTQSQKTIYCIIPFI